eukprot:403331351
MSNIAGVLQPTKFLLICIQIILLSIVLETKNEYIYNGILKTLPDTSDEYKTAYNYITGIAVIYIICVVLEFIIMFTGMTLFFDKLNLIQLAFHIFGIVASALFVLGNSHYENLWKVWIVGGVIPLGIEITNAISARVHFKRIMKDF